MMMLSAMSSTFIVENPASTLMFDYKYIVETVRRLRRFAVEVGLVHCD